MNFRLRWVLMGVILFISNVSAQTLRAGEITLQIGRWAAVKSLVVKGEKMACRAIYDGDAGIQMYANALFLKAPQIIDGTSIGFDNEDFREFRQTSPLEKRLGVIRFSEAEFERLLTSSTVRINALTVGGQKINLSLNVWGAKEINDHLLADCTNKELTSPDKSLQQKKVFGCEKGLELQLRGENFSAKEISQICGQDA